MKAVLLLVFCFFNFEASLLRFLSPVGEAPPAVHHNIVPKNFLDMWNIKKSACLQLAQLMDVSTAHPGLLKEQLVRNIREEMWQRMNPKPKNVRVEDGFDGAHAYIPFKTSTVLDLSHTLKGFCVHHDGSQHYKHLCVLTLDGELVVDLEHQYPKKKVLKCFEELRLDRMLSIAYTDNCHFWLSISGADRFKRLLDEPPNVTRGMTFGELREWVHQDLDIPLQHIFFHESSDPSSPRYAWDAKVTESSPFPNPTTTHRGKVYLNTPNLPFSLSPTVNWACYAIMRVWQRDQAEWCEHRLFVVHVSEDKNIMFLKEQIVERIGADRISPHLIKIFRSLAGIGDVVPGRQDALGLHVRRQCLGVQGGLHRPPRGSPDDRQHPGRL